MPELPEVETVRRGLAKALEGRRLARVEVRRPDLRYPLPAGLADRLTGRRVASVDRRGKYILAYLDDGMAVVAHLGMSGRFVISRARAGVDRHDHVILTTESGVVVTFSDPRRFGMIDLVPCQGLAEYPPLALLGPEPLSDGFSPAYLSAMLAGRHTPIKAALLDQRVVAGLGNIYVCEALFHAGISPRRLAANTTGRRVDRLVPAIKEVLVRAIAAGGSSLRDYVQANGELGYFQHDWAVYDREGERCPGCTCETEPPGGIRRIVQSGRSTYYCHVRQR